MNEFKALEIQYFSTLYNRGNVMRLTKDNYEDDTLNLKNKTQGQYNNELWNYVKEREDVEEEFGIDFNTLSNALKFGFWFKSTKCLFLSEEELDAFKHENDMFNDDEHGLTFCPGVLTGEKNVMYPHATLAVTRVDDDIIYFLSLPWTGYAILKDYGKTWALTKEELL